LLTSTISINLQVIRFSVSVEASRSAPPAARRRLPDNSDKLLTDSTVHLYRVKIHREKEGTAEERPLAKLRPPGKYREKH
jgi:hypothetical protein